MPRVFGEVRHADIAALLGVSERTISNHWAFAKAWLARRYQTSPDQPEDADESDSVG